MSNVKPKLLPARQPSKAYRVIKLSSLGSSFTPSDVIRKPAQSIALSDKLQQIVYTGKRPLFDVTLKGVRLLLDGSLVGTMKCGTKVVQAQGSSLWVIKNDN